MRLRICLPIVLLLLLCGCNETMGRNSFLLDTVVNVTIYRGGNDAVLDGALALCERYERMFSRTVEGSDVYRLNHAQGQPVAVSPEVREVLETALYYAEVTDGRYDITISPVVDLWDFTSGNAVLPDAAALDTALAKVGWQNVVLEVDAVRLQNGAQIDLGSIAKGFIADRMADYLVENGVKGAIINLGGNIKTVGDKGFSRPFRIGIQKPFADRDETIGTVEIAGQRSVVSSGIYERAFVLNGRLYHHILDPASGYPAETGLVSVTVISDSSLQGDALSTSLFLLGPEQGLALAQSLDGVEAALITEDGREHFTTGFDGALGFERAINN